MPRTLVRPGRLRWPLAATLMLIVVLGSAPPTPARAAETGTSAWDTLMYPFNAARSYLLGLWVREETALQDSLAAFGGRLATDASTLQGLVQDAGYQIVEIDVEASLLPAIALTLDFQRNISAEEEAALRAKLDRLGGALGVIEGAIVRGLLDLDTTVEAVRPDGYTLSEVEVDVDLIPGFTLMFEPGNN